MWPPPGAVTVFMPDHRSASRHKSAWPSAPIEFHETDYGCQQDLSLVAPFIGRRKLHRSPSWKNRFDLIGAVHRRHSVLGVWELSSRFRLRNQSLHLAAAASRRQRHHLVANYLTVLAGPHRRRLPWARPYSSERSADLNVAQGPYCKALRMHRTLGESGIPSNSHCACKPI